jgi:hypothetical protein
MSDVFSFDFSALQANLQPGTLSEKKDFGPDERFWKLSRGDDDTGTAIIRLLVDKNRVPFIKVFHHQFSVFDPSTQKKRWFIENSPQSVGLPCPVSEEWQRLQAIGTEDAKNKSKLFSRKIKYYTNILVVNDPASPENNGKVFLWEFGTKLLDKFLAVMNPGEDDRKLGIVPIELYNPMEGANIMLKIKKSAGFYNYDDTQIMPKTAAWSSMEEAVAHIDAKTYDLQEFMKPEYFKPYDELKSKMNWVITGVKSGGTQTESSASSAPAQSNDFSINTGMPTSAPTQSAPAQSTPASAAPVEQPTYSAPVTSAPAQSAGEDDLAFLDEL